MKKFLILWLVLIMGCLRSPTDVTVPELVMENRVLMDPIPPIYAVWYANTETCLAELARTPLISEFSTEGDFSIVNWYSATSLRSDGKTFGGVLQWPNDITIKSSLIDRSSTVRHEMAHHIVGRREIHFADGFRAVCDTDEWRDDVEVSFSVLSPLFMEVTNDNTIP